jgi:ubiquinone/menaquinone biosynthesis C-methylase UbiE
MDVLADRVMALVGRGLTGWRLPSPTVGLLGEARARAAARVRARHREAALALAARADGGDRSAAAAYGALADRALREMRREVRSIARRIGPLERMAAALHTRFGDTDEREYLDDPTLERARRVRILACLDAVNTTLGIYEAFLRAMRPILSEERPTRILDLAAGHGGFAIEAARVARKRGLPLEITASDLRPEYLALGREVAEREGLGVRFAVQDALDLSNLARGEYDVILCTQTLHHFSPASVARMFREAARAAGRGVVFIDGCRSVLHGVAVPTLGGLRYGDAGFAHDARVSFRRFFVPEELRLLTTLGPEGDAVEAKWMRPMHCLVRYAAA